MTDVLGLDGKPTLVIGGASGIGRASSTLLAEAGARVVVADINHDLAEEVAQELGGHAIAGDVTSADGARSVVHGARDLLGGLYGVINIVGVATWADLYAIDDEAWDLQFRLNLLHHLYVGRSATEIMRESGGGAISMVSSVSGLYGAANHGAYGAAKAGVNSLARTMASEWGKYKVRVNAVAPDMIATPRVQATLGADADSAARAAETAKTIPLARFGTPEEIAGGLVFLLSDLASFITGQTLVIDGGSQVRPVHSS